MERVTRKTISATELIGTKNAPPPTTVKIVTSSMNLKIKGR